MASKRSTRFYVIYWGTVAAAFLLVMAIVSLAPAKAHAAELTTGTVAKQSATALTTQSVTAGKATTANPYPDVTKKTVGKELYRDIKWMKSQGAYKGIISGTTYKKVKVNGKTYYKKVVGKFKPTKKVTIGEFNKTLKNLYGSKVKLTYTDGANAKKPLTEKYMKAKLVSLAKSGFGVKIKWDSKSTKKIQRATLAGYVYNFAHFDKAFMPK